MPDPPPEPEPLDPDPDPPPGPEPPDPPDPDPSPLPDESVVVAGVLAVVAGEPETFGAVAGGLEVGAGMAAPDPLPALGEVVADVVADVAVDDGAAAVLELLA